MIIKKITPFLVDSFLLVRVYTDQGIVGNGEAGLWAHQKTVYHAIQELSQYYIGKDPTRIEHHYQAVSRNTHFMGSVLNAAMSAIDVALWDLAGKVYGVPIYQLLGGYKRTLPAYASTYHGDENGGLSSPAAFADFALQCQEIGYPAFKIHGWGNGPIQREVQAVLETRKRVGDRMDLMIDPACEYETWADEFGQGENQYLWPYFNQLDEMIRFQPASKWFDNTNTSKKETLIEICYTAFNQTVTELNALDSIQREWQNFQGTDILHIAELPFVVQNHLIPDAEISQLLPLLQ